MSNQVIRAGKVSIFKIILNEKNPKQTTVIVSQKIERPRNNEPVDRFSDTSALLSMTQEGIVTKPSTFPMSILTSKLKGTKYEEHIAPNSKAAKDLYHLNLDANEMLAEISPETYEPMEMNIVEITDPAVIARKYAKVLKDRGQVGYEAYLLERVVKRSSTNEVTGLQYFLFKDNKPVYRFTEFVQVSKNYQSIFEEFTHYVELYWTFQSTDEQLAEMTVMTREEGKLEAGKPASFAGSSTN